MAIIDPTTPGELWYPIPSLPGYQLSSDFRVRRPTKKHDRADGIRDGWFYYSLNRSGPGYKEFKVMSRGRRGTYQLHRVVAEIFLGSIPEGMMVLHRDDNKENNFPSNLYFGNCSDNGFDSYRNGHQKAGEESGKNRLTAGQVREMRDLLSGGWSLKRLSRRFGCSIRTVGRVRDRISWRQLT